MGLTSLQVCMDTPDWLQGVNHEENGIDSSSSPSGDIMSCSRPLEKKRRPQSDQVIKCPRCDSTHTKFCYYNNYSLSQPRYFCKACRRYWTKGGSLRNIPVGGGCRKNKKVSAKKSNEKPLNHYNSSSLSYDPTNLQLSFSEAQLSQLFGDSSFMEKGCSKVLENTNRQGGDDFLENKFDAILGNVLSHDFMGTSSEHLGHIGTSHGFTQNFNDFCSPFGNNVPLMESSQRLMVPYESEGGRNAIETKPNKFFSLDWQDHGCSEPGRDLIGYLDGIGSWNNSAMNGYGSSATNPLM
ncbi:hypothetical protein ACHQM5_008305 [Ranunculus cassubicifolius]